MPVKVCYEHSYNSAQVLRKANAEHLVVSKSPDSVYLQDSGKKKQGNSRQVLVTLLLLANELYIKRSKTFQNLLQYPCATAS